MALPPILPRDDVFHRLAAGEIVLLPVDTLLGLAVRADCPASIRALYRLKGRDSAKPFALAFQSLEQLESLLPSARRRRRLLRRFLPGPWTFVLEGDSGLGRWWPHWKDSVGIRIPGPSPAFELLARLPWPIALTSANPSGRPPATRPEELDRSLHGRVACRLEGSAPLREGSTVVDLRVQPARLLRRGSTSPMELRLLKRKLA